MMRKCIHPYVSCAACVILITALCTSACCRAQGGSADLSFEVATVKPVIVDSTHPLNHKHLSAHISEAHASYWSMTLASLVARAYGVQTLQVTGPEWVNSDRYDIEAKFPDGVDMKDERKMLQTLLKDRFRLAFHIEQRNLDGYALLFEKRGAKLKPSVPIQVRQVAEASSIAGSSSVVDETRNARVTKNSDGSSTLDMGQGGIQTVRFDRETGSNHFELSRLTMAELAERLGTCVGPVVQKVVDETGLTGAYQVAYDCPIPRPELPLAPGAAGTLQSESQGAYVLSRSLDTLGLRLEKRKLPMSVYVIDNAERPSEN